jgi:anti-anti-sigma factor
VRQRADHVDRPPHPPGAVTRRIAPPLLAGSRRGAKRAESRFRHAPGGNTGYVPLYACEACGFTSAAFRPDAVSAHRLERPDCDGVMRIVFRSDDRYRGPVDAAQVASPTVAPPEPERGPWPVARERAFELNERRDPDGALRLTLVGDLDLPASETLTARLEELKATGRPARLDLSRLAFIDSSGLQALLLALTDARWIGWRLEVAPEVSPNVRRAAQIVGIGRVLWPEEQPDHRSDAAPAGTPEELA